MSYCLYGYEVYVTYFKQENVLQYNALNWSNDKVFAEPKRWHAGQRKK